MPRTCTVCAHAERPAIDAALAAGASFRVIAGRFDLKRTAVDRHRAHLPAALAVATEAAQVAQGDHLLAEVQRLRSEAQRLGAQAEKAGDLRTALQAVREQARIIELLTELAKVAAANPGDSANLATSPEWLALQVRILDALEPFPEAKAALGEALADA